MFEKRWLIYALISALFASLVGVLGKIGMKGIDSTLATAVRSVVMTLVLLIVVAVVNSWSKLATIPSRAFAIIVLSGIAGAVSWLFYFKAIQVGTVSQVAPIDKLSMPLAVILAVIVLRDRPTLINWGGIFLIAVGAVLASIERPAQL